MHLFLCQHHRHEVDQQVNRKWFQHGLRSIDDHLVLRILYLPLILRWPPHGLRSIEDRPKLRKLLLQQWPQHGHRSIEDRPKLRKLLLQQWHPFCFQLNLL